MIRQDRAKPATEGAGPAMLEVPDLLHDDHYDFLHEIVAIIFGDTGPRQPAAQQRTVDVEQLFPVALCRVAGQPAQPGQRGLQASLPPYCFGSRLGSRSGFAAASTLCVM